MDVATIEHFGEGGEIRVLPRRGRREGAAGRESRAPTHTPPPQHRTTVQARRRARGSCRKRITGPGCPSHDTAQLYKRGGGNEGAAGRESRAPTHTPPPPAA